MRDNREEEAIRLWSEREKRSYLLDDVTTRRLCREEDEVEGEIEGGVVDVEDVDG